MLRFQTTLHIFLLYVTWENSTTTLLHHSVESNKYPTHNPLLTSCTFYALGPIYIFQKNSLHDVETSKKFRQIKNLDLLAFFIFLFHPSHTHTYQEVTEMLYKCNGENMWYSWRSEANNNHGGFTNNINRSQYFLQTGCKLWHELEGFGGLSLRVCFTNSYSTRSDPRKVQINSKVLHGKL